jgi:glycosyltransferase involved in cell wall biosynthesis
MRIILFTDCLGAGGAQRQLVGLAIMLKEKGYDVKVATYYDIDFYKHNLDEANVPNELIPGADNTKKRILAVRRYFKKEAPDTVIAYQETPSLVASFAKVLGCKFNLIVSERNTTQVMGNNERVRFFLYRWADHIVPNSYSQEKFLKEHYPWMAKKLRTITNFVDLDHFSYVEHTKNEVPEIVVAATIRASKNTLGLLEAIKILAKDCKFHVSWYGKDDLFIDYYNECQKKIEELRIGSFVELKCKSKNIKEKYQEADIFCLPSFYEGTPNVICEAISVGLPVVCSNVCDNSIYVHDGKNGLLFDPQNPSDIAEKIKALINLVDNEYIGMRRACRTIAEELLSPSVFIKKYQELI